jgi:hypothetical protein
VNGAVIAPACVAYRAATATRHNLRLKRASSSDRTAESKESLKSR